MTEAQNELYEKAKLYAKTNVIGNCDELKCLAEMLYEFAEKQIADLEEVKKENAELRKVAEFQQSSNMNTHFENKKLKEGLTVGSMWNKHLNSQNKALEEERDRYRNMTFDQRKQLTKAKGLLKRYVKIYVNPYLEEEIELRNEAEQFLNNEIVIDFDEYKDREYDE